jgi:hypothetical protein
VPVTRHDRDMSLARPAASGFGLDNAPGCLLLVNTGPSHGLALLPRRLREDLLALLRHRSLDDRLATGEAQESSRLLAVRAAQLVSRRCRRRLARQWDELAIRTRRPSSRTDVTEQIQQVTDLLRSDQLVFAHGVAIALTMRGLAANAVHRIDGGDDLLAAITRAAVAAMTPR